MSELNDHALCINYLRIDIEFRIPSKHGPRPYVRVIKCLNLKAGNLGENQKKTWEKTEFILYLKNKSLE